MRVIADEVAFVDQTPVMRLRDQSGMPGIHHSRCVVGISFTREGKHVGAASAILIGDPARNPEFCLVSVRHAISRSVGCEIWAEINYPGDGNRLETRTVAVPADMWHLADDDDLACAPFPVEQLQDNHLLRCAHISQLAYSIIDATPDVTLVGRWGEGAGDNYILARSGRIATLERPEVRLDLGPDVPRTAKPAYIVDATVSRGMSGGAALVLSTPFTVMGMICAHGILPPPNSIKELPEGSPQQIALAIWEGIGAVNTGLAYLIPMDRIRGFLLATAWI